MCAILDANVAHQVFGKSRTTPGIKFFEWIDNGSGRLVIGKALLAELNSTNAREWLHAAIIAGRVKIVQGKSIEDRTCQLRRQKVCESDDPHIIALAQITRARLLYSNDLRLHRDFKNKHLIDDPRGKVYSTYRNGRLKKSHEKLLLLRDLCQR